MTIVSGIPLSLNNNNDNNNNNNNKPILRRTDYESFSVLEYPWSSSQLVSCE